MKSLKVGVTGGIGSGKSLVCKIFGQLGAPVYDADSRARRLMTEDKVLVEQIKAKFGEQSYANNGDLNREYLGKEVFNNSLRLEMLNGLVHPRVGLDSERWMKENADAPYVIKEAALLFEAGSYKALDKIIVVTAPEAMRVSRVIHRDKSRTREDVLKIIRSQMREEDKISRADFVLRNDESELLIPQILKLHERFINGLDN
ncbi:MAG TPA: dephospho-CoA kinase [Cyclobacteriaceae bacterium]|jgi:dephospho-CoA kinase|nr:dephospho-CoA kinase [Cyclobacteriaceae bacterium]